MYRLIGRWRVFFDLVYYLFELMRLRQILIDHGRLKGSFCSNSTCGSSQVFVEKSSTNSLSVYFAVAVALGVVNPRRVGNCAPRLHLCSSSIVLGQKSPRHGEITKKR